MIRRICQADAAVVARICEESLGHRTSVAQLEQRINAMADQAIYYIAVAEDERDHTVKGFIQAERYDLLYGEDGWNIVALAVAKEAQGQGYGKELLLSLETHAAAQGAAFVRLNSRIDRIDAHGFYEHVGYACDKVQKRFIRSLK